MSQPVPAPAKNSDREEAFNTMFAHMEAMAALYGSDKWNNESAKAGNNLGAYLKEKREEMKRRVLA